MIIRQFEPLLVPGLLQIEEYTDAVLRGLNYPRKSGEEIEARVEARAARQLLFDRDPIPALLHSG